MLSDPPAKPALTVLKEKLGEMLSYFDKDQRCIYVDYPLHTNVGDLLINSGCEQFFHENNVNIWRRYNYYDFPSRVPGLRPRDVLLLHGGGNFGDLWFHFQSFRERIMALYPQNRIIFLPQTVHFSSDQKVEASVGRMNEHRNYHVFVRDYRSLELLQRHGVHSVSAMPDTAHALAGVLQPHGDARASTVLRLLRDDIEASSMPPHVAQIEGDTYDWDSGVFSPARRMVHHGVVTLVKGVGRYGPPIDCHPLWYWHRDHLIADGVRLFSKYETIVTNRLHAIILGLLLDRSVIAFDNSYGKLSMYYQTWLTGTGNLDFQQQEATYAVAQ
jgi:pyruvyl transferase EpsO